MPKSKKETKNNVSKKIATPAKGGFAMTKLSVPVYALDGTKSGNLELPKEIFGAKVNKPLLSQAIRVYFNNQRAHHGNTKTRSEVNYSTKKQGPQKGSGHARHGSLGAPIFVGGGIALGPKSRKVTLNLPPKMKQLALISALSSKMTDGEILGLSGVEKASGKTKEMAKFLEKMGKKNVLIVSDGTNEKLARSVQNISGMKNIIAEQLNVFEVVASRTLMLTKEAVLKLEGRIK
ncbi:MAG: 50S ribosomal protein L4 [Candidatus Daviesbacteria bacterium]|nr:50S ribosomal protein L4 [Candidatus Daviesbacteria bacterium]